MACVAPQTARPPCAHQLGELLPIRDDFPWVVNVDVATQRLSVHDVRRAFLVDVDADRLALVSDQVEVPGLLNDDVFARHGILDFSSWVWGAFQVRLPSTG